MEVLRLGVGLGLRFRVEVLRLGVGLGSQV